MNAHIQHFVYKRMNATILFIMDGQTIRLTYFYRFDAKVLELDHGVRNIKHLMIEIRSVGSG